MERANAVLSPLTALILEVRDKEPAWIPGLWVTAVILGGIGFAVARRFRWAAIPFVVVFLVGLVAALGELRDPDVGPAIVRESGSSSYAWHLCASAAFGILLPIAGAIFPKRAG